MNENIALWIAFISSFLLHLVFAGVMYLLPPPEEPPVVLDQAVEMPEVELILLSPEEVVEQESQMPNRFTEIPERLATDEAPENPDFAALFNSKAADRQEGGDGDSPSAEEEWIVPKVEIHEDNLLGDGGGEIETRISPKENNEKDQAPQGNFGESGEEQPGESLDEAGRWATPEDDPSAGQFSEEDAKERSVESPELDEWWDASSPSVLKVGEEGSQGDRGYDFNQKEKGMQGTGVSYVGEFSLNTWEWNYAPWLTKFGNQLHRHWIPPYAYSRLGMIHGMTQVRMVINKDGTLEEFEVLDTEGHESLHEASEAALKAFAPYMPLPASFPEPYLVLTIGLHYPALR
ncbi:MAG: hypothetical protein GY780_04425 [bacterium]|nr:hypothetical protein [bacterium]